MRHFTGAEPFLVRLACVRRAANVRSEPGSNSPVELLSASVRRLTHQSCLSLSFRNALPSVKITDAAASQPRHNLSRCAVLKPRVYVSLRFSFQRPKPASRRTPVSGDTVFRFEVGAFLAAPRRSSTRSLRFLRVDLRLLAGVLTHASSRWPEPPRTRSVGNPGSRARRSERGGDNYHGGRGCQPRS